MRVRVDDDVCAGHGVCAALCPEVFTITQDGYAAAVESEIPSALQASALEAAEGCPEQAVRIVGEGSK